ncbi:MAG TPA: ribose-phosphate diphosphokinase [Steroidobacteraceae bacterium]|jgi:ribose-phosphate pyrophosphokinase|nr:ribose-phosphate diphosphokinase [Steroidobacteraceae bacterium]
MLVFAPNHSAALGAAIVQCLGASLAPAEEREFAGGEHKMRPLVDVQGRNTCVISSLYGDSSFSANDKLCRLLFFVGALQDAGAASVTTLVPYLAYARKDRRTQLRDPVTTRYVAAMFEAVGVDRIIALDVHNEAAFDNAFRCHSVRLEGAETFADALADDLGQGPVAVASPDIGGIKRAQKLRESLARRLGREVEFGFVEKRRVGEIVSGDAFVGRVAGAQVVLYDDLISTGTTILRAAQAARRAGAERVRVAATHAAFVASAAQLFVSDAIDSVLVSDSITLPQAFRSWLDTRLRVCSMAPLLAQSIYAGPHPGQGSSPTARRA